MPLMDRIKTADFLSLSSDEQLTQIKTLQLIRTNEIKLSKTKPKRTRKKATKGKGKKSTNRKTQEQKVLAALKKLTPEQLELIQKAII